jgi:hypothetical protein
VASTRTLGVRGFGDVRRDELPLQALGGRGAGLGFGIGDDHLGALFMEPLGDPRANAARSANDQRDFARETSAHAIRQNVRLLKRAVGL